MKDTPLPAEMIRQLLKSGMSQAEIAESAGTTQPTISRILTGANKTPSYSLVDKLRAQLALRNPPADSDPAAMASCANG